ncbi:hypothetical protein HYE82_18655 [Streptomyces sp. BR123]|uniref:hypothetical protein n=1 Tax=Streptomyces sp. BR123 TaxID=2749828 RepID=UPI0015C489B8|nr:hypothetical protein [Streptomyces sp. BR123]NXY96373.1 hypothetical protein [Streptomyces sp. BR123]
MAEPIHYVDRSDIREGRLAEVRDLMRELAAFVEAHEPRLLAYGCYIDESGSTMSVVAVHPDTESMEFHMEIGGPKFREFGPLIRLRSIDVFGRPGPEAVRALRQKAEMLGGATVTLHALEAGFSRQEPPRGTA